MPKRSSKPDVNQIAKGIADFVGGEGPKPEPPREKDPNAVALGRKGGLKGGKARAAKMTPEERHEVAKKAAQARWDHRKNSPRP